MKKRYRHACFLSAFFGCFLNGFSEGEKICLTYFELCQTYFKLSQRYFLFAPMRGLRSENQFSIFGHGKRRFQTSVCLSEFLGRAAGLPLEHPYEMLRILKAEHVGNLAYGLI